MNFIFMTGGLLSFSLFLFLIIKRFSDYEIKSSVKIMKYFIIVGFSYLALAILSFLWFFEYLKFSQIEYSILYSVIILIQNIIFFKVIYMFSKNKKLYYILSMYLMIIPVLFLSIGITLGLFLILSFLFSLLIFIYFTSRDDEYQKVGYVGIFYSVASMITSLLFLFDIGSQYIYSIGSIIILIYLFKVFIYDIKKYPIFQIKKSKKRSYFISMMRHLIFIITITNFVFIGTVGIHEFGHFGAAQIYGCADSSIVYDGSFFHTTMLCADSSNSFIISIAGIALPLFVAFLLIIIGGKFIQEIGLLMIGFDLLSGSRDLKSVNSPEILIFISLFVGFLFLIYGIFLLAKSKTEEEIYNTL